MFADLHNNTVNLPQAVGSDWPGNVWWRWVVFTVILLVFLLGPVIMFIFTERLIQGKIPARLGPTPAQSDKIVYWLAPVIVFAPAVMVLAFPDGLPWYFIPVNFAVGIVLVLMWSRRYQVGREGNRLAGGSGIVNGIIIFVKNLFRPFPPVQYPEQRVKVSRRIRGTQLVWEEKKCTGCATCARTCPQGVIRIVTHQGADNMYAVDILEVDGGYCSYCGLCVEACPCNALFSGCNYERAAYRRGELVMSKEDMAIEHEQASGYFHPEIAEKLPQQDLLIYKEKKK